jgi:hypothetical protein
LHDCLQGFLRQLAIPFDLQLSGRVLYDHMQAGADKAACEIDDVAFRSTRRALAGRVLPDQGLILPLPMQCGQA